MAKKKADKEQKPVSVTPPQEDPSKEDISIEILSYLQEQLPLLNTLITNFADMTKKQNSRIQAGITNSNKTLNNISETLKEANDQRETAADIQEERIAEEKRETALLEEKRAKITQDQNAEIITKLTTLNESIQGIELIDGASGGERKGLLNTAFDFLKDSVSSFARLALNILKSPLFLIPAVGIIGYQVGQWLSEKFISPQIEKAAESAREASGVELGMTRKDVVTDTGEKVFSKVSDSGETSLVTESQMEQEIAALPEQEREKAREQYSQKIDQYDPITGMRLGGRANYVESGISIEQMNQQLKDQDSFKPYDELFAAILDFDKEFRTKMLDVSERYKKTEEESGWQIAQSQYLPVLESMATEQNILINRINKSDLTDREKQNLFSLSPLFKGAEENKEATTGSTDWGGIGTAPISAAISGVMGYDQMLKDLDYTLPSGVTIDIEDLVDTGDAPKAFNDMVPPIQETTKQAMSGIPQLETGGVVYPKSSEGVIANISENMKPEAIVPLDEYIIQHKENDMIEPINLSERATDVIRSSYFEERDATQNQAPVIINNMNNISGRGGGGGSDGGANFQFQTDLAKTYDNVFDMILEKNFRTGIV